MVQSPQHTLANEDAFWRKLILPEEERRQQLWNGSYRWFRSPNVIDLWNYRSATEKQYIIDFMWRRQLGIAARFRVILSDAS
jgi:hypothetical protein